MDEVEYLELRLDGLRSMAHEYTHIIEFYEGRLKHLRQLIGVYDSRFKDLTLKKAIE